MDRFLQAGSCSLRPWAWSFCARMNKKYQEDTTRWVRNGPRFRCLQQSCSALNGLTKGFTHLFITTIM